MKVQTSVKSGLTPDNGMIRLVVWIFHVLVDSTEPEFLWKNSPITDGAVEWAQTPCKELHRGACL